jgi:hypothetical protein
MRPEDVSQLVNCGFCDQGKLRLMRCHECEAIVAVCDECDLLWTDLDAVHNRPETPSQASHPECPSCDTEHSEWTHLF